MTSITYSCWQRNFALFAFDCYGPLSWIVMSHWSQAHITPGKYSCWFLLPILSLGLTLQTFSRIGKGDLPSPLKPVKHDFFPLAFAHFTVSEECKSYPAKIDASFLPTPLHCTSPFPTLENHCTGGMPRAPRRLFSHLHVRSSWPHPRCSQDL